MKGGGGGERTARALNKKRKNEINAKLKEKRAKGSLFLFINISQSEIN